MFNNTSGLVLLAAMAGASSYAVGDDKTGARPDASLARAGDDMRQARVELYCDHRAQAIAAIRRATHALEEAARAADPVALAALDEAAWEAKRDHLAQAVAALDAALLRLNS